jgi:hypothetical protein
MAVKRGAIGSSSFLFTFHSLDLWFEINKNKKHTKNRNLHAHVGARDRRALRQNEEPQRFCRQTSTQNSSHRRQRRIVLCHRNITNGERKDATKSFTHPETSPLSTKNCSFLLDKIVCVKLTRENWRMVMSRSPSLDSTHLYSGMRSCQRTNDTFCKKTKILSLSQPGTESLSWRG